MLERVTIFSLSDVGVGPELCGRPADIRRTLGCGVPGTDGLSCAPHTCLRCCLSQVRLKHPCLIPSYLTQTVKGYRHLKKLNSSQTFFSLFGNTLCAGLWIYVVYITQCSLGMITRSCSTLYSQWQYLIYTVLRCAYSGNV
jgi:hypothetical protein